MRAAANSPETPRRRRPAGGLIDFLVWLVFAGAGGWAMYSVFPDLWLLGACLGTLAALPLRVAPARRQAALEARVTRLEEQVARLSEALDLLQSGAVPLDVRPAGATGAQAEGASVTPIEARAGAGAPDAPAGAKPAPAGTVAEEEAVRTATAPRRPVITRLFYGSALAKVGAALLLVALGSLAKLTAEYLQASVEARLAGVALLAVVAGVLGWRWRASRPAPALAMQVAALGVLYCLAWYVGPGHRAGAGGALVGAATSLALLAVVAATGGALACVQRSMLLSLVAIALAFAAPLLAYPGGADPQALLRYCLAVDVLVAAGSLARNARSLNLLSFGMTLLLAWSVADAGVVQGFWPELVLAGVLFGLVPVVFALVRGTGALPAAEFALVLGVPLAAVAAAAGGMIPMPAWYAPAVLAFAVGCFYFAIALALHRRAGGKHASLVHAHTLIGLAFVVLAVPLAFGAALTAMVLAAGGAVVARQGLARKNDVATLTGVVIELAAGVHFVMSAAALDQRFPVLNEVFAGCLVLAFSAFATSHVLRNHAVRGIRWTVLATPFGVLGGLWWLGGSISEIVRWAPRGEERAAILAFVTLTAVCMEAFGAWRSWFRTRIAAAAFPALLAILVIFDAATHGHVMSGWMAAVLPAAVAAGYWMLRRQEESHLALPFDGTHAALAWLVCLSAGMEWSYLARSGAYPDVWQAVAWGTTLALFAILISILCIGRIWPARGRTVVLMRYCGLPAVALGVAWVFYANATGTGSWGYAYVPVFNPLDASSTFALAVGTWMLAAARRIDTRLPWQVHRLLAWFLAAGKFWWANATVVRTVHHYTGMPYTASGMAESVTLQAILSVLWTVSAFAVMVWGTRTASRTTWFIGFGLLGIVGLKMVFLDLRGLGSAPWTFSLLGIAVAVMAAGYFTPTPPRRTEAA